MGTEAFWNGLFDTRWEDVPLGPEAIRLVLRLRRLGYCERTRRMYGHMVVHLGRVLSASGPVEARDLDEGVIKQFVRGHLPACRCYWRRRRKRYAYACRALRHLLTMLREEGVLPPARIDTCRWRIDSHAATGN